MRRMSLKNGIVKLATGACIGLIVNACTVLGGEQPQAPKAIPPMKHKNMVINGKSMPKSGNPSNAQAPAPEQTTATSSLKTQFQKECRQRLAMADKFLVKSEDGERVTHVKVGATGYGAPPKKYFPDGQRRLMTIRASKIDAYRALAEVVGGLHVWGGTSIGDMVIERDRYRVFVDTYVRGARVMSVSALEDGTYKTVVEMHVDQRFLSQVMAFIDPLLAQCLKDDDKDNFAFYGGNVAAPSFYYSE